MHYLGNREIIKALKVRWRESVGSWAGAPLAQGPREPGEGASAEGEAGILQPRPQVCQPQDSGGGGGGGEAVRCPVPALVEG